VETAILKEYPVAELGSTQPSTTPPSAAELAAERIFFYEEYEYAPPKINHVTAGQWLYRDLSTGGKDQEIWATADDSAQAEYVNGTLTVCQRADSCATSEQWLMPAGPSYSLIYPADRMAPSALPPLPRPLLDKLNTYSTGCSDVAGDCNAVNVAANVLTGYGNYPYLDASWFLALADVPGVSVKHLTDAAGNQDIAFTFPAQDGVTAILVNAKLLSAGTIQYEGYVRDGQQTLVLNQALVSGPAEYARKESRRWWRRGSRSCARRGLQVPRRHPGHGALLRLARALQRQGEMRIARTVDLCVEHLVVEVGGGVGLDVHVRSTRFDDLVVRVRPGRG
jgi:hypothetical protein